MGKLSQKEQAILEKLQAKAEAPDRSPSSRSVNFSVNLGNPEEVKLARQLGLIDDDDDDLDGDDDGDKDDDDGVKDDVPKRRGYFPT